MTKAPRNAVALLTAMALIWACLFFSCGCLPDDQVATVATYVPTLAAAVAISADSPAEPDPQPSDICENCNGEGRVGDGTVFEVCPVCDGTGKKPVGGAPLPSEISPSLTPPAGSITKEVIPKLVLKTGDGDWCSSCVEVEHAIEANEAGLADLLEGFDFQIKRYGKQTKQRVPIWYCGEETYEGFKHGAPDLVTWLKSQKGGDEDDN